MEFALSFPAVSPIGLWEVQLTGRSAGSILGPECFSQCLLSGTAQIRPPQSLQKDPGVLEKDG